MGFLLPWLQHGPDVFSVVFHGGVKTELDQVSATKTFNNFNHGHENKKSFIHICYLSDIKIVSLERMQHKHMNLMMTIVMKRLKINSMIYIALSSHSYKKF